MRRSASRSCRSASPATRGPATRRRERHPVGRQLTATGPASGRCPKALIEIGVRPLIDRVRFLLRYPDQAGRGRHLIVSVRRGGHCADAARLGRGAGPGLRRGARRVAGHSRRAVRSAGARLHHVHRPVRGIRRGALARRPLRALQLYALGGRQGHPVRHRGGSRPARQPRRQPRMQPLWSVAWKTPCSSSSPSAATGSWPPRTTSSGMDSPPMSGV